MTRPYSVGYKTSTLADDCQAVAVGFTEVDGSGFNLTSLKLDVGEARCNGSIYIETLNSLGYTEQTYYWYQNARAPYATDGWYNDDGELIGEEVDDIVFAPGTGLWLTGIDGEVLTPAGKVYQADLELTLSDDKQMVGNPYVSPIGLAANVEVVADGRCNGTIYIEILDSLGYTSQTYYWYQNARAPYATDGWYNDDGDLIGVGVVEDVIFPAGTGLWVTGIEDAKFNFISPIPASNN